MEKTIEIPEGYEARIEGNKVIIKRKESEDERIRKMVIEQMERWKKAAEEEGVEQDVNDATSAIAYLERQKEPQPVECEWPNLSNCIKDCKKCHGKCFYRKEPYEEQQPAEWSEEDKETLEKLHRLLVICRGEKKFIQEADYNRMDNLLNSVRRSWKPSEEQMEELLASIEVLENQGEDVSILDSLYNDLKKL